MKYVIYPPIGFARVGNSPDGFFIGPEQPGSKGVEIREDGTERPVASFKDANYRMKRQGARFHLFEVSDGGDNPRPATLPAGAVVRWSVRLANKKDAVVRPPAPPDLPRRVRLDPARHDRLIQAAAQVEGPSGSPVSLDGIYRNEPVNLGNIRTDPTQRLVVLGGFGRAESLSIPPAPIGGDFYNNPDWFDDVSDGPVNATITVPGHAPIEAVPAWVIVAPPDFAPVTLGIVTLYDVLLQVALDSNWVTWPNRPFFGTDIRPMIQRASDLRWVSSSIVWPQISREWARLSNPANSERVLRENTARLIRQAEDVLQSFELRDWQLDALDAWVSGDFDPGFAVGRGASDELTRAALDGTVGQGFFPGIEAGINITDPSIFTSNPFEFRFDPRTLEAGDMTAHMALPWQADFLKCGSGWWPAQRPNHAPQISGPERPWLRPTMNHQALVDDVMKLGVICETPAGQVIEQGRHPSLGN
jgi:hypothetical protein